MNGLKQHLKSQQNPELEQLVMLVAHIMDLLVNAFSCNKQCSIESRFFTSVLCAEIFLIFGIKPKTESRKLAIFLINFFN